MPSPGAGAAEVHSAADTAVHYLADVERRAGEMERQIQRLQRLAAMGTMSAMLAHEFRNLLTPVVSYVQYALERWQDAELTEKALQTTLRNTQTAAALCERIMRMARGESGEPTAIATVRTVADDAIKCLGRDLKRDGITLDLRVDAELRVRMDPIDLQQALFNLILNGRQAMLERSGVLSIAAERRGGTITPTCSTAGNPPGSLLEKGGNPRALEPEKALEPDIAVKPNKATESKKAVELEKAVESKKSLEPAAETAIAGSVLIRVADTGAGIRSDDLAHLFEPFFTTRRQGDSPDRRGLGLGLTVCRQLIEAAGGTIRVESRWGEGATFHIELPAVE